MLMMSFISLGIVTILWVLYGFGLAFGTDNGGFIGWNGDCAGLSGIGLDRAVGHQHHSGLCVRGLPADVRDHHPRADQRCARRPGEVHRLGAVHRPVGHRRLLPRRPLGVGRGRLALRAGRHRLRRRHRRAHQRRCRGARRDPRRRQAHRLQEGPDAAAQPAPGDARRRPAVVRLVRLQRRLLARQRRRHRRGRLRQHPGRHRRRDARLARRTRSSGTARSPRSAPPPARSPASSPSPRPAARSARSAPSPSASSPVCCAPWPSA